MNISDIEIKECVDSFVPETPESYNKMITGVTAELRERKTSRPRAGRRYARAAISAAAAVLAVFAAAVFTARPALAAKVPIVSDVVYAVLPETAANDGDIERLEKLLTETFRELSVCGYEAAAAHFRGDGMNERTTFLAAAYLNYKLIYTDAIPGEAVRMEITELNAVKKAFRFKVILTLGFVSQSGESMGYEDCTAYIWENTDGMFIDSVEMSSDGYKEYAAAYEAAFGMAAPTADSFCLIPVDNAILANADTVERADGAHRRIGALENALSELDGVSGSAEEKEKRSRLIRDEIDKAEACITPEVLSAEDTAAELMYRYWLGRMTGEVSDFSDVMDRNESTDLFFWDALLNAEKTETGALKPLVSVEKAEAEITEIIEETEGYLKARLYVRTDITDGVSQGVGEEIVLTLRKDGEGFTVVGFDRENGDGFYTGLLKPLAAKLMKAGHSWQEAGRMAYEKAHEQIVSDAGFGG